MRWSKVTAKRRKDTSHEIFQMEENQYVTSEISNGIIRYHRELPPSQHLLQINSYSSLSASKLDEQLKSGVFESGGYNWRMIVYLRGHSEANKDKYISLYLAVAETQDDELPVGWEVWVNFNLFVHDQTNDKYLVVQGSQNRLKRFCSAKSEWGFDEFLSMDSFKDTKNGYLVDDSCTFGAEVFVAKCSGKRECVSTVLKPPSYETYIWKLENFSQIKTDFCYSESFTAGGTKWKLKFYPKGDKGGRNGFVSIFLVLDETQISEKWYAESTLRVRNQLSTLRNRVANGGKWFRYWFSYWGLSEFISVQELKDTTKGFCVNDTVIIECQISLIIQAQLHED
ncbi:uncharacterized protein LOC114724340 [Neltuma alba]|uniref:uncharacterized protein LOC114724340 n=1 Tax=Neltuma alba TaxID=207710 RepID=UPI0010A4AC0D|nr:uncharacterized protein LOC114724340 [Prosopis alba]